VTSLLAFCASVYLTVRLIGVWLRWMNRKGGKR
jgi:hypothetical protein